MVDGAWNLGCLTLHNHHLEKVLRLPPIIDDRSYLSCALCSDETLQGWGGGGRGTSGLLWGRAKTDGGGGLPECPFLRTGKVASD